MAIGAILTRTSGHTIGTTAAAISWDAAAEVGGTFWSSGNPTRLTVPSGVSLLEVFFVCQHTGASTTTADHALDIYKNGALYTRCILDDPRYPGIGYSTGLVSVSPGDYFEAWTQRFGTGGVLDHNFTCLAAFTPDARLGLVSAQLNADTDVNAETALVWTVETDTLSTHDGTTGFVVPTGATHAIVCFDTLTTAFTTADSFHRLKVNGTTVRQYWNNSGNRSNGSCFGPIAVTAGQTLTVTSNVASRTLDADTTRISIEWLF